MLMLLIETNVRKTYVIATQDVLRGLEGPVLFSLTENGPKWGPNCADGVSVRGARARASYNSIISTIGNTFLPKWDQEGQTCKKSHQSTKAAGSAPAARPKIR